MTTDRVRFGIWSDNLAAAEVLQARLQEKGQPAATVSADSDTLIECLVVLTRNTPPPVAASLDAFLRLANRALVTIAVDPEGHATDKPRDVTLRWSGELPHLAGIARALVDLFRPAGLRFTSLPTLLPVPASTGSPAVARTPRELVERLAARPARRIVPVAGDLHADLLRDRRAVDRQDYDLRRLARWGHSRGSTAFISLRLRPLEELEATPAAPRALDELMRDQRTRRLVVLLGEPGSGKSRQLGYFDAHTAYQSIRYPDGPQRVPNTFHVALAEQPLVPQITTTWLAERWAEVVDVNQWCEFDRFLADGGTVLLDGLNEGGIRSIALDQWMFQWLGVIRELFTRGAGKIVVGCRTRDLVIPLRAPRDAEPTEVNVLPLAKNDIVAIATEHDPAAARRLGDAMTADPGLVDLYSNPFRLQKYLESESNLVATSGARLFGLVIAATIVRERDQLNFHGALIPAREATALATVLRSGSGDPWAALTQMPLVRAIGTLAKVLSFPDEPGGQAMLSMPTGDAGERLAQYVSRPGTPPVDPALAVQTALDLHILLEEHGEVRFPHPSMQHLFAAVACTNDEIASLAAGPDGPATHARVPDHRYEEVFQFAAQLRGLAVPDRLLAVNPVLAARVYLSVRSAGGDAAGARIVEKLLAELDRVEDHPERAEILRALGALGWALPSPRGEGLSATVEIPAGQWRLGRRRAAEPHVDSELRAIELAGFRISRFPVSNGEFAAFVNGGGYDDKGFWTPEGWEWRTSSRADDQFIAEWTRRQANLRLDLGRIVGRLRSGTATAAGAAALLRFARMPAAEIAEHARSLQGRSVRHPLYWHKETLNNPLQPVVGVSWFEANAFCKWMSDSIGAFVRLPSESEWEAACLFSLDLDDAAEVESVLAAEFGNTDDLGYASTTPIGAFATRRQVAAGLPVELMGNVFEWVFDYYSPGDHNRRILKGGSFLHERWRARPTYRGRGDVDTQNEDIGFRYVIGE